MPYNGGENASAWPGILGEYCQPVIRNRTDNQTTILLVAFGGCAALSVGIAVLMVTNSVAYGLAGAIAALGTFAALASTEAALYATITVACLDGLIKGLSPGMWSVLLKDAFLGVAIMRWMWEGITGAPRQSLGHPVALPAVLFIAYCVGQMFNTETMSWMLAIAGLRTWVIWIPVFAIAYDTFRTRRQFERLIMYIAFLSAATGIYGVVQHRIGFEHLTEISPSFAWYSHFRQGDLIRAPGTYVHPGTAGEAMSFAAILCAGVALASRPFSLLQTTLLAAAPVCLVALTATGSRTSLFGAGVGMLAFVLLVRKPQIMIALVLLVSIGLWQSDRYAGQAMSRRFSKEMLNVRSAWLRATAPFTKASEVLAKYPLGTGVASGTGVGRAGFYVEDPLLVKSETAVLIENEMGRAMKELGLPGAGLLMWLLWRCLRGCYLGWRDSTGRDRWLTAALFAGALNLVAQMLTGSALYLAPGGIYFWAACALASRVADYERQDREAAQAALERTPEESAEWENLARRRGLPNGSPP